MCTRAIRVANSFSNSFTALRAAQHDLYSPISFSKDGCSLWLIKNSLVCVASNTNAHKMSQW